MKTKLWFMLHKYVTYTCAGCYYCGDIRYGNYNRASYIVYNLLHKYLLKIINQENL